MQACDLFSTKVNLTFRGEEYYSTRWGRFVSMSVIIAFLILFLLRFIEFVGALDPVEYFSLQGQDLDEEIDLREIGFEFAVEQISPEYGYIQASQVNWSGSDGKQRLQEIKLEPCETLGPERQVLSNAYS